MPDYNGISRPSSIQNKKGKPCPFRCLTQAARHRDAILLEALAEEVGKEIGKDCDAFDLICHVAFDQPPLSRRERAEQVKKRNYFTKYGTEARRVLEALLDKYADTGIENIESMNVLQLDPLSGMGTPLEIVQVFGGKAQYQAALQELAIY